MSNETLPSPDGRFRLDRSNPSGDHFCRPDLEWELIDLRAGKILQTFYGRRDNPAEVQDVGFSSDGKELVARDGNGKVSDTAT